MTDDHFSKIKFLPKNVVHQGSFIAGHPGGKSEEPELSGDHRGELGGGGAHQEGGGQSDVLPHTPSPGPGHRAHQLQGVKCNANINSDLYPICLGGCRYITTLAHLQTKVNTYLSFL